MVIKTNPSFSKCFDLIFNCLTIFIFYCRSTAELSNHHAIEEQKPSPTELTTVVCSARFLSLIVLYIPAWQSSPEIQQAQPRARRQFTSSSLYFYPQRIIGRRDPQPNFQNGFTVLGCLGNKNFFLQFCQSILFLTIVSYLHEQKNRVSICALLINIKERKI